MADALRNEPDARVNVVDGAKGELTVTVDGEEVARKSGESLPAINEVIEAVRRNESHAGTGG